MHPLSFLNLSAGLNKSYRKNIVGYASAELQEYGLTAGACFTPISAEKVDLIDMKITGYTGEVKAPVEVQTLDEYGRTVASYFWYDYTNKKGAKVVGWLDEDDEPISKGDVQVQAGEGLWTYCDEDGFGFQSNGEVPASTVVVELQEFGLSIANPTPVTVDLVNCIISGYTGEVKAPVEVQTLDEYGRTVASYFWYDYTNKKGAKVVGWLDEDDEPLEEEVVTMTPGSGLWTYCDEDGYNFVFPGVEIK